MISTLPLEERNRLIGRISSVVQRVNVEIAALPEELPEAQVQRFQVRERLRDILLLVMRSFPVEASAARAALQEAHVQRSELPEREVIQHIRAA